MNFSFFVSCAKHLEDILELELNNLGIKAEKKTVAGLYFSGTLHEAYRVCLWSRIASHVVLQLAQAPAKTGQDLYAIASTIPWYEHFGLQQTFSVHFSGHTQEITHTNFGALKIKDAIVDQFRKHYHKRPDVDKVNPDILIYAHLRNYTLYLGLDLAGDSLHRRAYRFQTGAAPLKENLAAAILYRANWPTLAKEGLPLLDPLCGSGTILIEAALIAADHAPGLFRKKFALENWLGHIPKIWKDLLQEANERREQGLKNLSNEIRGYDIDSYAIKVAQMNIERAGLQNHIRVMRKDLVDFTLPTHKTLKPGLIVSNPPYGERLNEQVGLTALYKLLGKKLKDEFVGWQAAIFTANTELSKHMPLRAYKYYQLYNGDIACRLFLFNLKEDYFYQEERPLSPGAEMFANRVRKNLKKLAKWVKTSGISCYRIYDADMPEYAVAIDFYDGWLHVQEYRAPKTVDPAKVKKHLEDIMQALPKVLPECADKIIYKERRQQKGKQQYERQAQEKHFIIVNEHQCRFYVNLTDYLDTGLFLDHRPIRLWLQQNAKGKHVLNLFCYTATASVHAAYGGALSTTNVDLSNTYLDWGKKNFYLNKLLNPHQEFIQANVLDWLDQCKSRYDLIFLDPPTFSNSKRMENTLDVQRDHVNLISKAMSCLSKEGQLIFSTNYHRFKLEESLKERYQIQDITSKTIDLDFAQNNRIHQCFIITHTRP